MAASTAVMGMAYEPSEDEWQHTQLVVDGITAEQQQHDMFMAGYSSMFSQVQQSEA